MTDRYVFVADKARRRVLMYDRTGVLKASLPTGKESLSAAPNPMAFAFRSDTLFVLDLTNKNGIVALHVPSGAVRRVPLARRSSTMDVVQLANGSLVVAEIGLDDDIAAGSAELLRYVSDGASIERRACRASSVYAKSLRAGGIISMFREIGVATDGQRVYCRQPVTPVVQVFDGVGFPVGTVTLAPPFYKPIPRDIPATTGFREIAKFTSTWTEHARFFPYRSGFLSVYRIHDLGRGVPRYHLFACDGLAGGARCRTTSMDGEPLHLVGDSLFVLEPMRDRGMPQAISVHTIQ